MDNLNNRQLISMSKIIALLSMLLFVAHTSPTESLCQTSLKMLSPSLKTFDLPNLPIFSLMYSGFSTNSPGQKYECENKTPPNDPYHYLLVSIKNTTVNVNTFMGICMPANCSKEQIETILINDFKLKNIQIYDYPVEKASNGFLVSSYVIMGIWVGVLVLCSIWTSCKQPVEDELIKKDEEVKKSHDRDESLNSLVEEKIEKNDFKLFNFYQGYSKLFKKPSQKHVLGSIMFLATLSILLSTEFSYRQTIAANQIKSMKWFNSWGGVLFCNVELAFNVIMFVLGTKLAFSFYKLSSFHQIGRYFFDQLLMKWLGLILSIMAAYILLSMTDEPLNQIWKNNYGADCSSVMYQMWLLFRTFIRDCKVCLQWFWILEVDIMLTICAAPLYIVYRTKKWLGNILFLICGFISLVFSYGILQNSNVLFEPYKIFNMAREFTINYQTNALVRIAPYVIGILFGLFTSESKEKHENSHNNDYQIIKAIRRNPAIQISLHIVGLLVMILTSLLIIPYLPVAQPKETRPQAYTYLVLAPFGNILGLAVFLLPFMLQGESKLTVFLGRLLGASFWNSLQKMSLGFLWMGPVVMGFSTYSMQNSIYFDFQTIFVYFVGDFAITFVLTLLAVSSINNQLSSLSVWMQAKLFSNESKYSMIEIED